MRCFLASQSMWNTKLPYQTTAKNILELLRKLRSLEGVKKVFVRSGIRFDYLMADGDDTFFRELVEHHVSGQLKVAPEHISDAVLRRMGKPENAVYERFVHKYEKLNRELGRNQFLVPYLMSSHPGSTLKEAIELAEEELRQRFSPALNRRTGELLGRLTGGTHRTAALSSTFEATVGIELREALSGIPDGV